MTRLLSISLLGAAFTLGCAACGGQPIGSKVPRPDHGDVAFAAAAAATALTLADPSLSGKQPEQDDPERRAARVRGSSETVPADVLDRADEAATSGDGGEETPEPDPCDLPEAPKRGGIGMELIPTVDNSNNPPRTRPESCPEVEPAK